jgi:hypothetical protein
MFTTELPPQLVNPIEKLEFKRMERKLYRLGNKLVVEFLGSFLFSFVGEFEIILV